MKHRIVSAVAVTAACLALAGCQGREPDFAACKQAIRAQIDAGEPVDGQRWKIPPVCDGVDQPTLNTLAYEAVTEKMKEDIAKESTPTPS